jgi:2-polyprenyl-6-methoxyphenol hydroxylase-like FAD-dependent oxidoreductase
VPVLIAGGGIVGLSASLFLSRHGVRSLLVERHPGTSIHPRARGVNARTMELYRELGIDDRVREAGAALAPAWGIYAARTLVEAIEPLPRSSGPRPNPLGQALNEIGPVAGARGTQDVIEPVLAAAARERGGELRFHTELRGFTQDADGVTATVLDRTAGIEHTLRAGYLIAADGAGSRTKASLGVATSGVGVLGHLLNVLFRLDLTDLVRGREFSMCMIDRPEVRGLLTSIDNRERWVFHVVYRPERGERPEDFPPERVAGLLRLALGMREAEPEVLGILPWEPTVAVADRFRHGRILLAGDAAHQMPPWGGQGANTGVQDVHNLAWKLAAVLAGTAPDALLDSYDAERQPVGLRAAEESGRAAGPDGLMSLEDGGHRMAERWSRILGYGIQYRSPVITAEPGELGPGELGLDGRPGTRVPHAWVERSDGARMSTLDAAGPGWALLAGERGDGWCAAARAVCPAVGVTLDAHRVGLAGDLRDGEGVWRTRAGIEEEGALLVRPDGFVAWRARGAAAGAADAEARLRAALERALGGVTGRLMRG